MHSITLFSTVKNVLLIKSYGRPKLKRPKSQKAETKTEKAGKYGQIIEKNNFS